MGRGVERNHVLKSSRRRAIFSKGDEAHWGHKGGGKEGCIGDRMEIEPSTKRTEHKPNILVGHQRLQVTRYKIQAS